ncbi:MAG: NAD(P)-dependent oxidoreductase [Alphaproteobacteria bacterium]|nr:NAD(P)-dependent oxidoreductase [Alphaproteobacteria bacterium]MCY4499277.1 NAD(P)-dependent oxidoreductase [Rhodospirillaceae bacterium]
MERVGYIGLGVMGTPMSSNLLKKGFEVTVFDIDQSKVPPLVELGASSAGSVAEVSENSDIVITMLPGSPQVTDVVSGSGGIIESGRPGMIVLDTSTIYPKDTDALAEAAEAAGMIFVDAAVGGLPPQAISGTSLFMVGGEAEDVERVRPLLEAMGDTIIHCGPAGTGIRCKVVNNFLTMITAKANAEAFSMAMKAGLPADTIWQVVTGTTATNGCLTTGWLSKMFSGDLEPGFAMRLARKDLSLGIRLADELGVDTPLADLALDHYDELLGSKYADKDFSAIVSAACEAVGVEDPVLDRRRP